MNKFRKVNTCRCCGDDNLYRYLNLGNQPLANNYHKGEENETYPLEVNVCLSCSHSQLSVVVNPNIMFKNYLYVSGTTKTFRDHCAAFALDALETLGHKARVLDIASNDGTLLSEFDKLGAKVQGIDPAENLQKISGSKPFQTFVGYWPEDSDSIDGNFDIITGQNVFAHVDNAEGFLRAARERLNERGLVILEFPYAEDMIEKVEFDTVYHEHLSYFTVRSFRTLANRVGFTIIKMKRTTIHGGSIRFYLSREAGITQQADDIRNYVRKEDRKGLTSRKAYQKFSHSVDKNKKELNKLVTGVQHKDGKVVGYGASAKGNTMLNHFGIDLDYIVDDNDMKWGYKTPGRDIDIVSPDVLRWYRAPLHVVVLSWNFYDEIHEKVTALRGDLPTKFVRYVPSVSVSD